MTDLIHSLKKLEAYIISEEYKGYDPYDSLMSPLFKFPLLRSNKIIRFGFQQVYRRIPFNTRKLFGIKKGLNPVTLGLCIQAYTYLSQILPAEKNFYLKEIDSLLDKLILLKSKGFSGACWGYDFDWEARYAKIPAYFPSVVATGIIINSLFENYKILGNPISKELCVSSANFVMNDLNRSYDGNLFCFSYTPADNQKVFNATMKAARLLSQVYFVTKDKNYILDANNTVRYVLSCQKSNGCWSYSKGDARKWVDNFHTGYILDCLFDYIENTGINDYKNNMMKGFDYYINTFFYNESIPKYYNNSLYPIDATAIAQSIMTLTKFKRNKIAKKIAGWSIENMKSKSDFFYFQKTRLYKNKIPYMRWVNAWMFLSLSYLCFLNNND